MTSRILVFVGTRRAIEEFDMRPDWQVLVRGTQDHALPWFKATEGAKLATTRQYCMGWRAPPGTLVFFHRSWNFPMDAPESLQAFARSDELAGLMEYWQDKIGKPL